MGAVCTSCCSCYCGLPTLTLCTAKSRSTAERLSKWPVFCCEHHGSADALPGRHHSVKDLPVEALSLRDAIQVLLPKLCSAMRNTFRSLSKLTMLFCTAYMPLLQVLMSVWASWARADLMGVDPFALLFSSPGLFSLGCRQWSKEICWLSWSLTV